jgi:hypothetical protein
VENESLEKVAEGIKLEALAEIESLEKEYEIIKNVLKGIQYDLSQIRTTLQSFKDRLSKVRSLIIAYFQMQGKNFDLQTRPIMDSIDNALVLMEVTNQLNSQKARAILQLTFAMSTIKVEDLISFISTIRKTTLQ